VKDTAPLPVSRILVVDDNQAIHEDFRKVLDSGRERAAPSAAERALFGDSTESRGAADFEIDSAYQGQEGLTLVQQALRQARPYAMAFIDVRMPPGWDGITTTAQIWKEDPDIQVVICTAYSDYSWSEMLAKLGRSDRLVILKKPFDPIEVLQLASALTEKWRLARQARTVFEGLEVRIAERTHELVLAGERLQASETQYRLLFDGNPHPMWVYDLATLRFLTVNRAAILHYGYSGAQFLTMTIHDIRSVADLALAEASVDEQRGQGLRFDLRQHLKQDGSIIDVEISSDTLVFDGQPARLVLSHDVTERRRAEAGIKRLNRVYAVLSGINTLIVRVRSRDDLFRGACQIAVDAGGFRMAMIGIIDRVTLRLVPMASAGADDQLMSRIGKLLASGDGARGTMIARAIEGGEAVVSNDSPTDPQAVLGRTHAEAGVKSMAVLPLMVGGKAVGVLALYAAETDFFLEDELKLLTELADDVALAIDHLDKREQLNYLAYYDPLTGLANRSLLLERVAQHMRSAAGGIHKVALCLIDLERFKSINDSLGRPAGDDLLKQVAEWLTQNLGDVSLLAHVGADHFAVVLPEVREGGDALRTLDRMIKAFLEHPFILGGAAFRISAKLGVALFPEDGGDAETLFLHAEAALKRAKASGDRYLFYTQQMTDRVAGRLTLENQLKRALDQGEFVLHYEPQISVSTNSICAAEALIRWNDPRSGLVPPGRFIPVLEETGLIHDVGRWVLHKAIEDYRRWLAAGLPAVRIAVNVSPMQLRNHGFVAEVEQAIGAGAGAAAGLELEITESLIVKDVKHSIDTLQAIRALGVTIAIDDFGTGFSSLSYLSRLPVDKLKIDRSFVNEMTVSANGLSLVSTIINLAHALKLGVVAEGVETEEQSRLLRLMGCDQLQGYLLGRSMPVGEFESRFLSPAAPSSAPA
jgi:diguanylate cyclase (GGDEF)-like protein/PAS domain S-box-containing protein